MTPGNVVGLDVGIRVSRHRTKRSSQYERKLGRVGEPGRRLVLMMEAKLYAENRRFEHCRPGCLHHPEATFEAEEGCLWYYYSVDHEKFVLTDFMLAGGGGSTRQAGGAGWCGWGGYPGRVRSLAARIGDRFIGLPGSGGRGWRTLPASCTAKIIIDGRAFDGFVEMLAKSEDRAPAVDWSLLSQVIASSAQLQNPYARAILAGEALCRLSTRVPTRRPSWSLYGRRRSDAVRLGGDALAKQSRLLLSVVHGADAVKGSVPPYWSTGAIDRDLLGDDARLAAMRGEMVLALSRVLAGEIAGVSAAMARPGTGAVRDLDAVLRKCAMLSEFVRLSARYFGTDVDRAAGGSAGTGYLIAVANDWEDWERLEPGRFGSCSSALVRKFLALDDEDRGPPALGDLGAMHDRLSELVAEILEGG